MSTKQELKFTPGPRRAYQDPEGDWHVDNWSPRNGNHDGLIVARFGHGVFSEGNAKLDAAAPDLYKACEAVAQWWAEEVAKHEEGKPSIFTVPMYGAPGCIFAVNIALDKAEETQTKELPK